MGNPHLVAEQFQQHSQHVGRIAAVVDHEHAEGPHCVATTGRGFTPWPE
jgi:hypothetical protein